MVGGEIGGGCRAIWMEGGGEVGAVFRLQIVTDLVDVV